MRSGDYEDVDHAGNRSGLVRYVDDVTAHPLLVAYCVERARLVKVAPGQRVLEIGCGTGIETLALAEMVGPTGSVAGVDRSREMLARARARAVGVGNVAFRQADAAELPFEDGSFDLAWSSRVLMYVEDPVQVAREVRRALRRGGHWLASEPYFPGLMIDVRDDVPLEKQLRHRIMDGQRQPAIALSLRRIAREAGFAEVRVEPRLLVWPDVAFAALTLGWETQLEDMVEEGSLAPDGARAFLAARKDDEAEGRFFAALPVVAVIASA